MNCVETCSVQCTPATLGEWFAVSIPLSLFVVLVMCVLAGKPSKNIKGISSW